MFIWTGRGYLLGLVSFFCLVITQASVDVIAQQKGFYATHDWPKSLGLCLGAAACLPLGRWVRRWADFKVQQEQPHMASSRMSHTILFIPVEHWWKVLVGIAIIIDLF